MSRHRQPTKSEDEIAWTVIEKMAVDGAKILEPLFDPKKGTGRISIQTNTKYFNNAEKLIEQAIYFNTLAPNMQVKAPCTSAGIKAFEEMTLPRCKHQRYRVLQRDPRRWQ